MKRNETSLKNKGNSPLYPLLFLLAFALTAALVWGFAQRRKAGEYFAAAGEYMGSVSGNYIRCAGELQDNVREMETSLAKLRVSASERQTVLALEDVVRSSAASVSIMSRLPRTHEATEKLMVFLVRTGDYARCLSRRVLSGERLPAGDVEALESMYECCSQLALSLRSAAENGELPTDMLEPSGYYADGENGFAFTPDTDSAETVPEYPTLIYDGPFSESTEKAAPKGLNGGEVSEDEALAIAEKLIGTELSARELSPGRIPVYLLEGEAEGVPVGAAVTVTGGRLLWFMRGAAADEEAPSGGAPGALPDEAEYEKLVSAAKAFLGACGYEDMAPSYSLYYDGMALFSFIWERDGVRVYNDLVKVWLDRMSGEVIGLDANNYLFSHRERHIPAPALTEDRARSLASARLEVDSAALALIPLTPNVEALCYELHGYCGGEEYAVYINALTGAEEQIFLIVNDGTGKTAV